MNRHSLILALCSGLLLASPAQADVIGLRTNATQTITLALNAGVEATLTWGDGTKTSVTFDGTEQQFTVADPQLSIATSQSISSLYVADAALTSLDVSGATHLLSLVCAGNELTTLNLAGQTSLVDLDCSENQLAALDLSSCPALVSLDCSKNQLTTINLVKAHGLQHVNCSNNKLTRLGLPSRELISAWCHNNELNAIVMPDGVDPVQIVAFNNQLPSLDFKDHKALNDLWMDNNAVTTLDLSTVAIQRLSASNNALTLITYNKSKKVMTDFYVDGNALAPVSLIKVYNPDTQDSLVHFCIAPQAPFVMSDNINVGDVINTSDYVRLNGWGQTTGFTVDWETDAHELLVKDTDYKVSGSSKYTFLTGQWKVRFTGTSTQYPGLQSRSAYFRVVDPTGVDGVVAEGPVRVSARGHQLVVDCQSPMRLRVCHASGRTVIDEPVSAGTHTWQLPAGVYVAAGVKVIIR